MSWITIAWSMVVSACLTLAVIHLVIWSLRSDQHAHLLFAVAADSVAAIAVCELLLMRAQSPEQFGSVIWWTHFPLFLLTVSIVGFVRLYFRAGRPWLGYAACGLRLLDLIINLFSVPNVNYKQITGLQNLTLGRETISVALGEQNPWVRVSELSSLLLLLFVVDASITLWRRGDRSDRRRALVVGGSVTFFIFVEAGHSALLEAGLIQSPYLISFSFLPIVAAMGYELGSDVVRAARLARQLQASETALRESEQHLSLASRAAELEMLTLRQQSEERFRLVVEAAPNAMVMVTPEGKIALVNAQVESVFGYARQELVGRPVEMLVPERFRAQHPQDRTRYFADPKARAMGAGRELFGRRKDGREVPIEIGLNPIRTSEGLFVLASIIDITQRREAELEAERQRNDLAYLSRLTMLTELSGSLAHELNQPLGAILSNAETVEILIKKRPPDLDELGEILSDIRQDAWRAGEVIHRMRSLLKKGQVQLEPLDINQLVDSVVKLMRSDLAIHNVALETRLAVDLPAVNGDDVQLQQVLLNLMLNGCDAMAGVEGNERRLLVRTELADASEVCLSVFDQGCGIPPERLEQIFEPFFTTKTRGTGLGLAVCHTIITAHGGKLWATNNAGRGATVQFTLPVIRSKRS